MTLANAHALFNGIKADPSYLASLDIGNESRANLMAARKIVRATLKAAAPTVTQREDLWESSYRRSVTAATRLLIEFKFMTQGSFAYRTINNPAKSSQEIDLDDGMYVPVHFLDNGQPALTAKALFKFVESTLQKVSNDNGWDGVESKQCCVRVKLWQGAHIDIPIYSIPKEGYEELEESRFAMDSMQLSRASALAKFQLPKDKIMLAQEDGTWIQSDPQEMQKWVDARVKLYGPVFRRACRYVKGWRDHTWEKSPLSSICIMAAVDTAIRDWSNHTGGMPTDNRDDEITLEVAKRLPSILSQEVSNPVISGASLNDWDVAGRNEVILKVNGLKSQMEAALTQTGDATKVVEKLRSTFGNRIPFRPDVVKIAGAQIAAIENAQPARNPAPRVIPSTSG